MTKKISTLAVLGVVATGALLTVAAAPSLAWGGCWGGHPVRSEILHRDGYLNGTLNRDYGRLGGHYGQLKAEDRAIRLQTLRDARMNGGYLTRGEQVHLNREENRLQRQIRWDRT